MPEQTSNNVATFGGYFDTLPQTNPPQYPLPQTPTPAPTCPNCGYCPHCGRGTIPMPYRPIYISPYPSYWPTVVCSGGSGA